jgi:type IV fimbrial biogenesis protein FimT
MHPALLRSASRGHTLVELLVTLVVGGVLASMAVPMLGGLAASHAVKAAVDSFESALRLARVEAVKRGELVSVCARDSNVRPDVAACASSGKDWSAGWLVFVDRAERGTIEDDDVLLQVHQPGRNDPVVSATLRYVTFQATGISLTAASHVDFLPRGDAHAAGALRLCINKPGRVRQVAADEVCST